jgi:hypothetical protein
MCFALIYWRCVSLLSKCVLTSLTSKYRAVPINNDSPKLVKMVRVESLSLSLVVI